MRIQNIVSVFILSFSFITNLSAQARMRDCIARMPDSLMTLLTEVNRADCVDFREAGMGAKVTNRLGGTTELSVLTDDYALWQYTSASQVEMKLLPLSDSTRIVCMIRTVQLPVSDSRIAFFDEAWTPMPASRFAPFLYTSSSASSSRKPAESLFTSLRLSLSPDSLTLQAERRSETYEPDGEGAVLVPSSTISHYNWVESRFVPR